MKKNVNKTVAIAAIAVLCLTANLALAGSGVDDVMRKGFEVESGMKLVMDVDRGNIAVKTGDGARVEIEVLRKVDKVGEARAAEIFRDHDVHFEREGNEVRVNAKPKSKPPLFWKGNQLQVSYTVLVPKQFDLDLHTRGGNIHVGDLKGDVKARTAAGNVKLGRIDGPVQGDTSGGNISVAGAAAAVLKTSAGNVEIGKVAKEVTAQTQGGGIEIDSSGGNVKARTAAGNIRIGEVAGDAELNTSGGSIKVQRVRGTLTAETAAGNLDVLQVAGPATAITHGGSIQVGFSGQPKGDCRFETSAGNIRLTAPASLAVDLQASTSAGEVTTDLPIASEGKRGRSSLAGKMNGGGPKLTLITRGGNVSLKRSATAALEQD